MKHNYLIKTHRLDLRQVEKNDLYSLLLWRNDDNIRKWFFDNKTITLKKQYLWYEKYLQNDTDIMFIIDEKSELETAIGSVALYNLNTQKKQAEFGRLMIGNKNAMGKGFGLECTSAVCDFGFNNLNLNKIYLEVYERNTRAIKIYEQAGFTAKETYIKDNEQTIFMTLERENF